VKDSEGTIFPSIHAAKREGIALACDIAKHGFEWLNKAWRVVITDDIGVELTSIRLAEIHKRKKRLQRYLRLPMPNLTAVFGKRTLIGLLTAVLIMIIMQAAVTTAFRFSPICSSVVRWSP
jgi:hypothetical protein